MKKIVVKAVVTFTLLFLITAAANAQLKVKRPKITVGANFIYAIPQGNFKDAYKFGVGGELYGGVGLGSTYLVATVGVVGYKSQSSSFGLGGTLTAVPVKVGFKQYFLLKKLFINGDIGTTSLKVSGESSSQFTAGIGAGVRLLGLELGLYYNAFHNIEGNGYANSVQVKAGWSFAL